MFGQIKEFFKPFPKPGSLAYKFWCWRYGVKPDKPPELFSVQVNLLLTELAEGLSEAAPTFEQMSKYLEKEFHHAMNGDPSEEEPIGLIDGKEIENESDDSTDDILDIPTYIRNGDTVKPRMDTDEHTRTIE